MKIEITTKTFNIDSTEFVIAKSEDEYSIVAGAGDDIQLEEDYTTQTLPERYNVLFNLNLNEKLGNKIICVDVEKNVFKL